MGSNKASCIIFSYLWFKTSIKWWRSCNNFSRGGLFTSFFLYTIQVRITHNIIASTEVSLRSSGYHCTLQDIVAPFRASLHLPRYHCIPWCIVMPYRIQLHPLKVPFLHTGFHCTLRYVISNKSHCQNIVTQYLTKSLTPYTKLCLESINRKF